MLTVTNGDSAVGALKATGIDGHIFPWRDVLHETLHLFGHHRMRFQAVVEVEDDLGDACRLDLFQVLDDLLGRADEYGL